MGRRGGSFKVRHDHARVVSFRTRWGIQKRGRAAPFAMVKNQRRLQRHVTRTRPAFNGGGMQAVDV